MADETKQIYESREWHTGDVITADALNKIENEMEYVSAEVTNAVTGTINDQKLNDTIARKLDSIVKYFPEEPTQENLENVRLYVKPEENDGEITVPTIDDYQTFKTNFVQPYTNKAYAVGDYVEYGDVIYRVLSAITKNGNLTDDEAWTALNAQTPSPVTSIDVMQELNGLINVYTSDNQVTSERNKIWIKQQGESVEIPTYEEFSDLKNAIKQYNCYNLLQEFSEYISITNRGVTYTWNAEKTECTATGTASGISTTVLYSSTSSLTSELVPGKKYMVFVESTSENLFLDSYWYYDGGNTHELFYTSREFTVPQNCIGAILRIRVTDGTSVENDTISVSIRDAKSNKELEDALEAVRADGLYQGVLSTLGYTSCNDVWKSGLYFKSSESSIDEYPFPSGYLLVESSSNNESSLGILQIAYAYGASYLYPKYRKKVSSTWTDWYFYDELSRNNVTKIFNDLFKYGSYDAALYGAGSSGVNNGLTYTNNGDGTWLIDGTVENNVDSFRNIITGNTALPEYVIVGRTYTIHKSGSELVHVQIFLYNSSGSSRAYYEDGDKVFIPDGTTGIIVRFKVNGPATLSNETINVSMVAEITETEQTIVNQEIHNDTFNNTYNITTSPQITTDTNGWLQPVDTASEDETNKTDMSGAIMSMLNSTGYCHLAPGVFYVSGFDMPDKSTLVGCGKRTEIRLLSSVTNGYAIKIQKYCTVKDLSIYGSYSSLDYNAFTADKGTRHGIVFNAQYAEGGSQSEYCTLSNIFIHSFTGCGIKCYNTSISTHRGLYANQVYISICQTGLFVEYHSEFNKFEQVCTRYCYVACENNGGNNTFISCTFSSLNTGFLIDNSLGDKSNNSHGSLIGCTFCHIGSNQGVAIAVKGATNGYVFSGCQIWYCSILVENSNGIVFNNMEFGRGTTGGGATIRINGGDTVMFTGCVFMSDIKYPPDIVITDNTKVRFNSCYGSASGNAITGT